jgi:hypothetical protein
METQRKGIAFRRSRRGLKDTIKINIGEIGLKGVEWFCFLQVRDK